MFEVIRSETDAELVELNARLLAAGRKGVRRADRAFDGRRWIRVERADAARDLAELEGIEPIDRSSMTRSKTSPSVKPCSRPGANG